MSGLPLLFKKEGLIERHQVEGIDPSDRYFNRAVLVSRVAAGYTGKVTYEAYAVEGSAHSTTGAAVKAVVELNAGQQVGAEELIARCKEKLGSVKAPKSVDFVDALPRSPVGKVLKKDLRARYWQNISRKI